MPSAWCFQLPVTRFDRGSWLRCRGLVDHFSGVAVVNMVADAQRNLHQSALAAVAALRGISDEETQQVLLRVRQTAQQLEDCNFDSLSVAAQLAFDLTSLVARHCQLASIPGCACANIEIIAQHAEALNWDLVLMESLRYEHLELCRYVALGRLIAFLRRLLANSAHDGTLPGIHLPVSSGLHFQNPWALSTSHTAGHGKPVPQFLTCRAIACLHDPGALNTYPIAVSQGGHTLQAAPSGTAPWCARLCWRWRRWRPALPSACGSRITTTRTTE